MKRTKLAVKTTKKNAKSEGEVSLRKKSLFQSPMDQVRHLGNYREFFRYLLAGDLDRDLNEVELADEPE